jgi:uncharacterized protein (DUF427 family)
MGDVLYPKSERLEPIVEEWLTHGRRPTSIESVSDDEESVWDYPRAPSLQEVNSHIILKRQGISLLNTKRSIRVCETASAPTYYFWKEDFVGAFLKSAHSSYCEWKGRGTYWSLETKNQLIENVAWSYEDPYPEYEILRGLVSFYPVHFETYLDDEKVRPQPGGFYAGWVTDKIKGPIKGGPGSQGW